MRAIRRALLLWRILLSFYCSLVSAQSVPGATHFVGSGINGGRYELVDNYQPSTFFRKFNYFNGPDPTRGHVQYVNREVATRNGYSQTRENDVIMSVDTTNRFPRGGPGRPSTRLISDNTYTHGLFVIDLTHIPWGCGTWPAFWLLGPEWPRNGEVDIIEGVHTSNDNSMSLHTASGCRIAGSGATGTFQHDNCDWQANQNSGCGFRANPANNPNNYGDEFNRNGGGMYVTEWTSTQFQVWFFPRQRIPPSIVSGSPNLTEFGRPTALFQGCDIDSFFNNHSIIINTDFCGDWAGNVYSQFTNCPGSVGGYDACIDYVGNNPEAFVDAFWQINYIQVYQASRLQADPAPAASSSSLVSSSPAATEPNTIPQGMGQATSGQPASSSYTGPLSSPPVATPSAPPSENICPDLDFEFTQTRAGTSYQLHCEREFATATISSEDVLSFRLCLEYCETIIGCGGVAFLGRNGPGTCYTRAEGSYLGYNELVTNATITSGVRQFGAVGASSTASGTVRTDPAMFSSTRPPSTVAASTSPSGTVSSTTPSQSADPLCGTIYQDPLGARYEVRCNEDNSAPAFQRRGVGEGNFTRCFGICSNTRGCVGFTFVASTSFDGGDCYLKSTYGRYFGNNTLLTSAFLVQSGATTASSEISSLGQSATTSASSSPIPDSGTCPATSQELCSSQPQTTRCTSTAGSQYEYSCGSSYRGTVINTDDVAATYATYRDCTDLCDRFQACVASNYEASRSNCTLFSSVDGVERREGGIAAAFVRAAETASTRSSIAPSTLAGYPSGPPSTFSPSSASGPRTGTISSYGGLLPPSTSNEVVVTTTVSTFQPTVISTLPSGATVTTAVTVVTTVSGPPPSSEISAGTTASIPYGSGSLCFTCYLTPTVITVPPAPPTFTIRTTPDACSTRPRIGTTTIFSTATITNCAEPLTCPLRTTNPFVTPTRTPAGAQPPGSNTPTSGIVTPRPSPGGGTGSGSSPPIQGGLGGGSGGYGSGNSTPPVCPGSNLVVFTSSLGQLYEVVCSSYWSTATLSTTNTTKLATCIDACDRHNIEFFLSPSPCRAVAFFPGLSAQNCELKSSSSTIVPRQGVDAARLITPGQGSSNDTLGGGGGTGSGGGGTTVTGPGTGPAPTRTVTTTTTTIVFGTVTTTGPGGTTVLSTFVISGDPRAGTAVQGTATIVSNGVTVLSTYAAVPSTVFGTSTAVSTFVVDGVTFQSTFGVSTVVSIVFVPGPTQTVTTTSATTETSTTTTISVVVSTRTATQTVGGGGGDGTVTVTAGTAAGTATTTLTSTVFATPSRSSSTFSCRTTSTNYLGRSQEPAITFVKKRGVLGGEGYGKKVLGVGLVGDSVLEG